MDEHSIIRREKEASLMRNAEYAKLVSERKELAERLEEVDKEIKRRRDGVTVKIINNS